MRNLAYLLLFLPFSCTTTDTNIVRKISPTFYHWQSVLTPTPFELKTLDSLSVETIYIRMFDIGWNKQTKSAEPISKIIINDKRISDKYNIIPTIFITDECIFHIQERDLKPLAENIVRQVAVSSVPFSKKNISQLQIDCDWTKSSKDIYFKLLKLLKELLPDTILSATIRLHQIKFSASTGIPPVERGMLMCYNMGNMRNPAIKNSIIEVAEAEKYLGILSNYPLQLDIAFPLFNWIVLFREDKFKGLIQNNQEAYRCFSFINNSNVAIVPKDTTINGISFLRNDKLRFESSENKEILKLAQMVSKKLKTDSLAVAFYHLDSLTLSKFNVYELENICHSLQ